MAELTQRRASLADVQGIWGLLRQVSADVPFALDSELEQESILSELVACCTSGLTPIAVDNEKGIVGALLARRDDLEWGLRNNPAIHVAYAAMAPGFRDPDLFAQLLGAVTGQKVSVFASVKAGEQQGFATALSAQGFTHEITAANGWGDLYQWTPPAQ
ncbi:hypothetical protein [Xanthobacter agilis]|uniref:N-acetyltransferase domain-containing protein n=1 Tax=Xanthobacter agilis TaxID=47492 RepID=A0ABU0LDT9_XANAG|nr:hypothetical protein [Xanthobacter agilis]MDQ0505258.1 hypothetical protein [Xanthobacter agilis]